MEAKSAAVGANSLFDAQQPSFLKSLRIQDLRADCPK